MKSLLKCNVIFFIRNTLISVTSKCQVIWGQTKRGVRSSIFFFSFTLYPAHSGVDRGNLMKDTPFPTFCRIMEAMRVKRQNSTPRFALTTERRNGNINLSKYFISSSGNRTHNQSVLQSHLVPLRHDRPQASWNSDKWRAECPGNRFSLST